MALDTFILWYLIQFANNQKLNPFPSLYGKRPQNEQVKKHLPVINGLDLENPPTTVC